MKKTELTIASETTTKSIFVNLEYNGKILTPNYDLFVMYAIRYVSPTKEKFFENKYMVYSLIERSMFENNYKFVKYIDMTNSYFTANDVDGNLYFYREDKQWHLFESTHVASEYIEDEFDAKLMIIAK